MVRALVDRLPVMVTPRWVGDAHPADRDRGRASSTCCRPPTSTSTAAGCVEIGGPDRVSYGELMREYARQRGLRRAMIPVPVLSPRLSSLWLGLVTPVYARVGPRAGGGPAQRDRRARPRPPRATCFRVRPRGVREAIARALVNEDREFAATRWSDALSSGPAARSLGGAAVGSRLVDSRAARVPVPPEVAFAPIRRIGGRQGWYYGNAPLAPARPARPAVRRRRARGAAGATPSTCSRATRWTSGASRTIEPDRLLRLSAEMRLPGRAWLQFEVEPDGGGSIIRQTAVFDPAGRAGAPLLVRRLAGPRLRLPRDGPRHRGREAMQPARRAAPRRCTRERTRTPAWPAGWWTGWPTTGRRSTR